MNSLYGRFGRNPVSTITVIVDESERDKAMHHPGFTGFFPGKWLFTYFNDPLHQASDSILPKKPRNAAVQMSAAITAYARIYMYPFSSRDDCYYTDTDSVFLSNPLPDHMVDSNELGKFKLEGKIKEAYFLAPKSYRLQSESGQITIRHKGATRNYVT